MVKDFTFLITKDIVETLQLKYNIDLTREQISKIREVENGFVAEFWQLSGIPEDIDRKAIGAAELSDELGGLLRRSDAKIVSLDRVYVPQAAAFLEVTRKTDPTTGNAVGVIERPKSKPLQEQIEDLKQYSQIALADVGSFEGKTILEISALIEKEGIRINEIYLAISNNAASETINGNKKLQFVNGFNLFEWVELRDLIGIDGRNIGIKNGIRQYLPYWENLVGWASVEKGKEEDVVKLCRRYNEKLLEILGKDTEFLAERIGIPVQLMRR